MSKSVETHYGPASGLAERIRQRFAAAGKDVTRLTSADLAPVDEFHIRGRHATLEIARKMDVRESDHVLDVGSGLGGPARTLAETCGCKVTGIDLTRSFCDAATEMARWVGLSDRVRFVHGDATRLPFEAQSFDAAMTIHAAMNIPAKDAVYAEVKRVLKRGRHFVVYDVLQGEGGPVLYPVPWAREPSISWLATPGDMQRLLSDAGFELLESVDSTEACLAWFREMTERMAKTGPPPVTFAAFLGENFAQMAQNQVRNLAERRIRVVTYVCRA